MFGWLFGSNLGLEFDTVVAVRVAPGSGSLAPYKLTRLVFAQRYRHLIEIARTLIAQGQEGSAFLVETY